MTLFIEKRNNYSLNLIVLVITGTEYFFADLFDFWAQ